jgi:hypothetical protein
MLLEFRLRISKVNFALTILPQPIYREPFCPNRFALADFPASETAFPCVLRRFEAHPATLTHPGRPFRLLTIGGVCFN